MGKQKLRRFRENEIFENVFQPSRDEVLNGYAMRGAWREKFFKNDQPLVLELGCGKGEYTIGMARAFPDKNFVGVDIKGARLWFGAKEALDENLSNVAFLRTQIEQVDYCFGLNEIDEIWITFPDPQIKFKRAKHRLTAPAFLGRYKRILKPGGYLHLKTDSEFLHGYTLGILEALGYEVEAANHDIYGAPEFEDRMTHLRDIKTYYEGLFSAKGKKITYLRVKLDK